MCQFGTGTFCSFLFGSLIFSAWGVLDMSGWSQVVKTVASTLGNDQKPGFDMMASEIFASPVFLLWFFPLLFVCTKHSRFTPSSLGLCEILRLSHTFWICCTNMLLLLRRWVLFPRASVPKTKIRGLLHLVQANLQWNPVANLHPAWQWKLWHIANKHFLLQSILLFTCLTSSPGAWRLSPSRCPISPQPNASRPSRWRTWWCP